METWDAMRSRRKIAEYAAETIDEDDLNRILEAGRRSPSSRNEQRWDFVVVRDRQRLEDLSHVWRGAAHIAQAPAAIGVVAPFSEDARTNASINFDLGQTVMSMMIAAADLGIGTRHASVEDYAMAARVLELPDDVRLTWLFGIGYPGDRPLRPISHPDRRELSEIVHWETW